MKTYTINDFMTEFPDDDSALDYLLTVLYPAGVPCKKCGKVTQHYRVAGRQKYGCTVCRTQVSPTAGTILDHSPTPVRSWLYAIHLLASTRCGCSAKQLQRELGVTYKCAWRMFNLIRKLLDENDEITLSGPVEADETYVGGKDENRHFNKKRGSRGRGDTGKTIVAGIVERHNKVVTKVVPNVTADTLVPHIQAHVAKGSTVYTDELSSYNRVARLGYEHRRIYHAGNVFVQDDKHTNTLEGFWSLVKRGINGAYHAVSPKYLGSYVNEYGFRYNHRDDETPMFRTMVARLAVVRASESPS